MNLLRDWGTVTTRRVVLLWSFTGLLLCGCGGADTGGRVALSGTVNLKGAPLANGTIEFAGQDGSPVTGGTIVGGKFSIQAAQGLKPGKYLVRISAIQDSGAPLGAPGTEGERPQTTELIPEEFNVKSTKYVDVSASGSNVFPFDIP